MGHALAPQPEYFAELGTGRDGETDLAREGRDLHLVAQGRLAETERHDVDDVVILSFEQLVGFLFDNDEHVARRSAADTGVALALEAHVVPVAGADRDVHLDRNRLHPPALPLAGAAGPVYGFPLPLAVGTGRHVHHDAEQGGRALLHLALALAGRTGPHAVPVGGADAAAVVAGHVTLDANRLADALGQFFQGQLEVHPEIFAAVARPSAGTTAEDVAENPSPEQVPQYVLEIPRMGEVRPLETARSEVARHALVAEPVVTRALVRIAEHLVGLGGRPEFLFRRLVARVPVRMIPHGQLPVRFLYLVFGCRSRDTQGIVIVLFCHLPLDSAV